MVQSLSSEDAESISDAKVIFKNKCIPTDLAYIKANFGCLVDSIKKLQTKGLVLRESIGVIKAVGDQLKNLHTDCIFSKFSNVFQKNPGYHNILQINSILYENKSIRNDFVEALSPAELSYYKNSPTTSTDVERSFSIYSAVLTNQRRSFLLENLKQHMIVHCNYDILE